jgi:hypothetical protein
MLSPIKYPAPAKVQTGLEEYRKANKIWKTKKTRENTAETVEFTNKFDSGFKPITYPSPAPIQIKKELYEIAFEKKNNFVDAQRALDNNNYRLAEVILQRELSDEEKQSRSLISGDKHKETTLEDIKKELTSNSLQTPLPSTRSITQRGSLNLTPAQHQQLAKRESVDRNEELKKITETLKGNTRAKSNSTIIKSEGTTEGKHPLTERKEELQAQLEGTLEPEGGRYCSVCNVEYSSPIALKTHFKTQKHLYRRRIQAEVVSRIEKQGKGVSNRRRRHSSKIAKKRLARVGEGRLI